MKRIQITTTPQQAENLMSATPRRDSHAFEAIDPVTGSLTKVWIAEATIIKARRTGLGAVKDLTVSVPHVLKCPTAIFEGLRQETDEPHNGAGWRCYCGVPLMEYSAGGVEFPTNSGQVYLVFVNHDSFVYSHRWDRADPTKSHYPVDYETRFRTQLL